MTLEATKRKFWSGNEIRGTFLRFFESKGHRRVRSSSLVPHGDPTLLFTNAGMNQFKDVFLGLEKRDYTRATSAQKCVRAGGKHNDLENVGFTKRHHTFFEMLGNFSFGDYFKKEAIAYAWELVTSPQWYAIDGKKLYATVFGGAEVAPGNKLGVDEEARRFWLEQNVSADRVVPIPGLKDNFWAMGDTGPCGPCSEIFYDMGPAASELGHADCKFPCDCGRYVEIWNLVFMQFNRDARGTLTPLPKPCVDTGMGLERVAAVLQGVISNYDTDLFAPLTKRAAELCGVDFNREEQMEEGKGGAASLRVIADHARATTFLMTDGVQPSNDGRGYVLRRILRRAVRYGRSLGFHEPFFFELVDIVAKMMGDIFPEIRAKEKTIKDVILREEGAFNKTLDKGIELFERDVACGVSTISGAFAFRLYDEQGFPLDLTELMARERGLPVDVAGFEKLMEEQRDRARRGQKKEKISVEEGELKAGPTKFLGYDFLEIESVVDTVLPGTKPEELNIVLDQTPFYAEMGGQVGDRGLLHVPGHNRTEVGQLRVIDTQKRGDVFVHRAALLEGRAPEPGEAVRVSVDADRRRLIQGHHTVTHLLHWALHEVVSRDASQKGSYVGPDKLTFDFSSAPLTKQQVRDVEKLVNEKIAENAPVSWTEIPYAVAKERKDIIQFFGEKYGDTVRVLQIAGVPHGLNGYSMELCGGTHVRSTGDIGPFRIVKEEAIAAGIRRVEAVAGEAARSWAKQEAARQQKKFAALSRKKSDVAPLPAFENDATTSEMLQQIDARAAHLEKVELDVRDWEKQSAKTAETELKSRAAQIANQLAVSHAGKSFCVAEVQGGDGKLLQAVVDALKSKFNGPIFLVGATNESVALVASVPKERTPTFQANKLIQQIAPIVGGKGGGRPENAQGAGKDPGKIGEALAKAKELLG